MHAFSVMSELEIQLVTATQYLPCLLIHSINTVLIIVNTYMYNTYMY